MTANDLREALSTAVREEHGDSDADHRVWTWLRDHTDERGRVRTGRRRRRRPLPEGLLRHRRRRDPHGSPVEVQVHTTYLPVGDPPPVPSQPPAAVITEERTVPNLTEAEERELRESVATANTQRDAVARELATHRAHEPPRP